MKLMRTMKPAKEKVQCPTCKKSVAEKDGSSTNCPYCGPQKGDDTKVGSKGGTKSIPLTKGARSSEMKPKYEAKNQKKANAYKNEGGPEYQGSYGSEDY
jgi:uncharacterized Zn finger protein (UPF0148 family)